MIVCVIDCASSFINHKPVHPSAGAETEHIVCRVTLRAWWQYGPGDKVRTIIVGVPLKRTDVPVVDESECVRNLLLLVCRYRLVQALRIYRRNPFRISLRFNVFEFDAAPRPQAGAGLLDAMQKSRIVLKTVIEPIFLRLEADQQTRRFAVTRNDNLARLRLAKKARQIILDFGQRNFLHAGFLNCASHAWAPDLVTIAKI